MGLIPGLGDPLEEETATLSSILGWKIPWTEEPGGLYIVPGVVKSWTRLNDCAHTHTHTQSCSRQRSSPVCRTPCYQSQLESLLGADPEPCPVECVSGAGPRLLPASTVTLEQEKHSSGFPLKTGLLSDVTDQEGTETALGL